jgi:hypothetical protein
MPTGVPVGMTPGIARAPVESGRTPPTDLLTRPLPEADTSAGPPGSTRADLTAGQAQPSLLGRRAPENASGSLVISATGRHIDQVTWRPAVIVNDLPQPLAGAGRRGADPLGRLGLSVEEARLRCRTSARTGRQLDKGP